MQTRQKKRLFLVGCPRSGTTLLQSLLAAHSEILSFPESHFCRAILGYRKPWRCKLGIVSRGAKQRLEKFLVKIERTDMAKYIPRFALFPDAYGRAFIKIIDQLSQEQGKNYWLEKT